MSDPVGNSGTPLAQKLGLKVGQRVLFVDLPKGQHVGGRQSVCRGRSLSGLKLVIRKELR